jgi:signal transduction histidine kinase
LLTKLALLFAALVAIPLTVNGIFLSVMGRNNLLSSGAELRGIAERTLRDSHKRLIRSATENAEQSSRELIRISREQLSALGEQQSRLSQNALKQSTERLIQTGSDALRKAMNRSVRVSHDAIDKSHAQLRALHQEAILHVSEQMVADARAAFERLEEELTQSHRRALWQFVAELNQQRARAAAEKASQFLEDVTAALNDAINTLPLNTTDASKVSRALAFLLEQQRLLLYAAVVSPAGRVLARQPDGALPFPIPTIQKTVFNGDAPPPVGRLETEWLLRNPAVSESLQTGQVRYSPVTLMKGRAPRMTVAVPMFKGSLELSGVLAVELSLEPLRQLGCHSFVAQSGAPLFIVANDGTMVVPPDPAADKLLVRDAPSQKTGLALPLTSLKNDAGTWTSGRDGDSALLGAYAKVKGTDWVAVSLVPTQEAMALAEQMRQTVRNAANDASRAMETKVRANAEAAVNAAMPQHQLVRADAARIIRSESENLLSSAIKKARQEQKEITDDAARRIQHGSQQAAQDAAEAMMHHADAAAQQATLKMQRQTQGIAQTSLGAMKSAAAATANRSGQNMMIHSGWLIAVFLLLALALAVMTAHSIVRPLTQLAAGTEALARGDFSQRVPVQSQDEIGQLAHAFNQMAEALAQSRERERAVNAVLSQQNSRLHAIVESTPDGLIMLDNDDRIAFLNSTAQRLLGVSDVSALPCPSEDLPPKAAARFAAALAAANHNEPSDIVLNEESKRVLQIRSVPVMDETGVSHGRLIHLHDVTREREIDEMKTNFVSLVSHELRTPLTSILAFSSYILTGKWGDLTPRQRTGLESMHRQAKRLHAIISDFLDVSRIESGRIEMQREPVAVADIAANVIEELRPQAAEKRLSVTLKAEPPHDSEPILALADEERIAQVMTNLIGNAIKFTDNGGQIDVTISRSNGVVQVDVRDTGCGIPPDELPKVFDRFYQVERVVTRKTGGTGLGLAIVKNIVEAHGGDVRVESQVGVGTTFSFTLPAMDAVDG